MKVKEKRENYIRKKGEVSGKGKKENGGKIM